MNQISSLDDSGSEEDEATDECSLSSQLLDICTRFPENSLERAKDLLERGADVNYNKEEAGVTPLIACCRDSWGCKTRQLELAKLCIRAKADLEARERSKLSDGGTALYHAAYRGHLEIVKCLVEAKARVDAGTESGEALQAFTETTPLKHLRVTPLHVACEQNRLPVVQWLVLEGKVPIDIEKKDGATALFMAAQDGRLNILKFLVGAKASIETPLNEMSSNHGWTPLSAAAWNHHDDVVEWLVTEAKANLMHSRWEARPSETVRLRYFCMGDNSHQRKVFKCVSDGLNQHVMAAVGRDLQSLYMLLPDIAEATAPRPLSDHMDIASCVRG